MKYDGDMVFNFVCWKLNISVLAAAVYIFLVTRSGEEGGVLSYELTLAS